MIGKNRFQLSSQIMLFLGGVLLNMLLMVSSGYAAIDAYDFKGDSAKERNFRILIDELRCPKCQNQNIAGSDAPLAKDIKDRVYKLLNEGRTNAEITQYMVDRYGDFVTYRPPVKPSTWFLWFAPLIALVVAFVIIIIRVTRRAKEDGAEIKNGADAGRIKELLSTYGTAQPESDNNSSVVKEHKGETL